MSVGTVSVGAAVSVGPVGASVTGRDVVGPPACGVGFGFGLGLRLRLRPDLDDLLLALVAGVPGVVVEQLPLLVVHAAGHARRLRRGAGLLDHLLADIQVGVRNLLDRHGSGGDERRRLALDAAVLRCPVEVHGQRALADEGPQQEPVASVVDELEVDVRIVDRRVAALRIVADVERVVRARRDRQPRLVGGVEHRRRDLARATAEAVLELAVDDHRRLEQALGRVALTGRPVERELLARCDQRVVDQVRDDLHVVDPVRRRRRSTSCSWRRSR